MQQNMKTALICAQRRELDIFVASKKEYARQISDPNSQKQALDMGSQADLFHFYYFTSL